MRVPRKNATMLQQCWQGHPSTASTRRHSLVLGVQDAQLGEDAHVRALEADAALQQRHELVKVAAPLVELGHLVEVVGVDDDVEAAQLAQLELLLVHARKAHLCVREGGDGGRVGGGCVVVILVVVLLLLRLLLAMVSATVAVLAWSCTTLIQQAVQLITTTRTRFEQRLQSE